MRDVPMGTSRYVHVLRHVLLERKPRFVRGHVCGSDSTRLVDMELLHVAQDARRLALFLPMARQRGRNPLGRGARQCGHSRVRGSVQSREGMRVRRLPELVPGHLLVLNGT